MTAVHYDDKIISYEYDELNNRTKMTDESGVYAYAYDNGNRLTSVKKDNKSYITYAYDKLGNATNINDTAYTYDSCSRMKIAGNVSYEYDANGNLAKTTLPVGETTYEYDERNRVTSVTNTVDGSVLSSYEYSYYDNNLEAAKMNNTGKITRYTYDGAGRLRSVRDGTRTAVYFYDLAGNRYVSVEYYDKNFVPQNIYPYEIYFELVEVEPGNGDEIIESTVIEPFEKVLDWEEILSADDGDSVTPQTVELGGTEVTYVYKYTYYNYTCSDKLVTAREAYKVAGETDENGTVIESEMITVGEKTTRYVYDDAGNRISSAAEYLIPAEETVDEEYGISSGNYDSVIEVSINEYNGLNQLVNTTNIKDGTRTFASYVYNGDGLRVQKTVDGTITNYTYSGSYIIAETGKTYLRGLSYHAVTQSGTKYYYFSNAHGDITNVVNSSKATVAAYDYDEFGNLTEETGTFESSFRYAGEYYDVESGNYYLRSRYYDPTIGRFTQQDSFLGYDDNPLSLNRYTYCHNNPIRYIDPSGHDVASYTLEGETRSRMYDDSGWSQADRDYVNGLKNKINGPDAYNNVLVAISAMEAKYNEAGFVAPEVLVFAGTYSSMASTSINAYENGVIDDELLDEYLGRLSAAAIRHGEINAALPGSDARSSLLIGTGDHIDSITSSLATDAVNNYDAWKILSDLQALTDDILFFDDVTVEDGHTYNSYVVFVDKIEGSANTGTRLIREVVESGIKTVIALNTPEPGTGTNNGEARNLGDQINILYDNDAWLPSYRLGKDLTEEERENISINEKGVIDEQALYRVNNTGTEITLGHELIHAWHYINKSYGKQYAYNDSDSDAYYKPIYSHDDELEKKLTYMKGGEELSTVGIDYYYKDGQSYNASTYPITENLLRAQLGYGVRIDYDIDDELPQNEIFKKADRSLLYSKKGN